MNGFYKKKWNCYWKKLSFLFVFKEKILKYNFLNSKINNN